MAVRDSTRGWWIPLPFLVALLVIGIRATASQVGQPRRAVTLVRSEGAWESVRVALGDGFSLRLRYRKQASPDMARWLEFEVDNRTGEPLQIRNFQLWMSYELMGSSSGSLISGNEAQVLPKDAGKRGPHAVTAPPGKLRLHGNLSAKASARLPIIRGSTAHLRIQCGPRMDTEQGHTTYGDMPPSVELQWRRPSAPALAGMRQRLEQALEDPDAAVQRGYDIGAWLQKPAISAHLDARRLLAAMSRCAIRSAARFAILRHLADVYGGRPVVRAHYLERLRAGEEAALEELSRATPWFAWGYVQFLDRPATPVQPTSEVPDPRTLWAPAFVAPIVRLMEKTPRAWHSGFRLLERHGAPQAGDPALAARLGDVLRKADVLASVRNRAAASCLPTSRPSA